jgi:hypothetical protein
VLNGGGTFLRNVWIVFRHFIATELIIIIIIIIIIIHSKQNTVFITKHPYVIKVLLLKPSVFLPS